MIIRKVLPGILLISLLFQNSIIGQDGTIHFEARQKVKKGKKYRDELRTVAWDASKTAIIICDMWDRHWCETATERVTAMAPAMNDLVQKARKMGITIVHAPSSTMDYYQDYPQRQKMIQAVKDPGSDQIQDWYYLDNQRESPLPIDDTDGGCDDPESDCVNCEVWTKQIGLIEIAPVDCISDSGKEINNYFRSEGIDNVFIMGVHTNMCVLGRSFGIRSHVLQGRNVVLVRDMTDAMYNPKSAPFVDHASGTNLVIDHIEKFWCPTTTANQIK